MRRAGWILVALCLVPLSLRAKPKAVPGASLGPQAYSVTGWGGAAVPLSPRGPDSFAVSYQRGWSGGGGLFAHWGPWGLGLEGTSASLAHQHLDHTSVALSAGAVVMEWNFQFEEGREEGPLFQWGAGFGQARLDSAYPGSDAWSGPATKLAVGYRLPVMQHLRLDLIASSWALLGDDKRDTVALGDLGLQVGLWW